MWYPQPSLCATSGISPMVTGCSAAALRAVWLGGGPQPRHRRQEIDLYIADAAGHGDAGGLLRQIFTAILADAPPGRDAEAGHRSDLLGPRRTAPALQ